MSARPLAVVTGASSGIGRELASLCASEGFDLVVAADDPSIADAAESFRAGGAAVEALELDLANLDDVDFLCDQLEGRQVDALLANAGHGLGHAFLDEDFADIQHVIDTNITGTTYLVQKVGREMRDRHQGRILITGSIAGYVPGTFSAVYNGTKAFIDSFAIALRAELKDATETNFFARAGMLDTKLGQEEKDDPANVARVGFDAMMRGDADVVSGWSSKVKRQQSKVRARV
jgi:uncharacterized protein